MDEAERWEYRIEILRSDSEPQMAFLRQRWPQGIKHPESLYYSFRGKAAPFPRYTPYTLQPQLDAFGEQGWELVTMQPVTISRNGDILIARNVQTWTPDYLCTFKKRKPR